MGNSTDQNNMDVAPKNGEMVWLLVDYLDGRNALTDSVKSWTLGFNNYEHDGQNVWRLSGWSWEHDCFCAGKGTPIAWKPLGFELEEQ